MWSMRKKSKPRPSCFIWEVHRILWARDFAIERAGSNSAERMAMIAITTNSSIRVNARRKPDRSGIGGIVFIWDFKTLLVHQHDPHGLWVNCKFLPLRRQRHLCDIACRHHI